MLVDTIAAISTALGEGGIAIIRVSGEQSIAIVEKIFASKSRLSKVESHTVHYGFIRNPVSGEKVDEVLVTVMRAPRSFTMEDVVEISCHGGMISVNKIMMLLLENGVRIAEPGEFTKRAFLNGRIDLSQAEAVIDMIRSKSDKAYSIALKQSEGSLSKLIKSFRQQLLELIAHLEVNIDYPEHDTPELTNELIHKQCQQMIFEIDYLLQTANQGKILREGIVTAIIGKPNVGKSSLLNMLAQENKAIVTDIAGTTRDIVEEYVNLNGIPLKLLDTAGIRETSDIVEQIGVERSRQAILHADLILFVVNNHDVLSGDEIEMMKELTDKQTILIINKVDLPQKINIELLSANFDKDRIVFISARNLSGLTDLERSITKLFFSGSIQSADQTYISNVRHIHLLQQAKQHLQDAIQAAEDLLPIDIIQIDIRTTWELLGEVIGDAVGESLIDQIFSQFCLGK